MGLVAGAARFRIILKLFSNIPANKTRHTGYRSGRMALDQVQPMATHMDLLRDTDYEEQMIIGNAVSGDRDAIDWLINRYRVRAVRLAMHILRRSGEAEDAAQEAFIKAFRELGSYRRDGKFY